MKERISRFSNVTYPGENASGLSGQDISRLPLETCETMNGMWGYKIVDQNYKSVETLIHYLVKAAVGMPIF